MLAAPLAVGDSDRLLPGETLGVLLSLITLLPLGETLGDRATLRETPGELLPHAEPLPLSAPLSDAAGVSAGVRDTEDDSVGAAEFDTDPDAVADALADIVADGVSETHSDAAPENDRSAVGLPEALGCRALRDGNFVPKMDSSGDADSAKEGVTEDERRPDATVAVGDSVFEGEGRIVSVTRSLLV